MPDNFHDSKIFSSLSVLVVEDSPVAAKALNYLLSDLGAKVTLAETGKQAIELITSEEFDFIILDFDLPDTKGPEIAKTIRRLEAEANKKMKPLILHTAKLNQERAQISYEAGINVLLTKPLTTEGIRRILKVCREYGVVGELKLS